MEPNLTNWSDFLVLGVFLFFLGIGWTFSRCYREFSRETEPACRNNIMDACFEHSSMEAVSILCFTGLILFIELLRSGLTFSLGKTRWNVWMAWGPFIIYALCRIAEDRWSRVWRHFCRLCLAGTFLCQFAALKDHVYAFPVGTDRAMYEPLLLLMFVTALVTLGETFPPKTNRMRWIRCGGTMVQGIWLIQIGFTLCVSGREWRIDDDVRLTVALIFVWHCALTALVVYFVRKTVKSALCAEPYIEGEADSYDEDYDFMTIYDDKNDLEIKNIPWTQRIYRPLFWNIRISKCLWEHFNEAPMARPPWPPWNYRPRLRHCRPSYLKGKVQHW